MLASDFAVRDRPSQIADGLVERLLQLAQKCSRIFGNRAIEPSGDNEGSRIGATICEAIWDCSIVRDDISATFVKFENNLFVLLTIWPGVALMFQSAVTGVLQQLPLDYQPGIWRIILNCRAAA
jgi:hypothetical protein